MAINFHCQACGKKIEAPDSAGGKQGKCPACKARLSVPLPDNGEPLKLAPIDEGEEARKRQLLAESYALAQEILEQTDVPDQNGPPAPGTGQLTDHQLVDQVVRCLKDMADGQLGQAQAASRAIAACGQRGLKAVDQVALSDMPHSLLAGIPPQVLAGLIRKLRGMIT